MVNVYSFVLLLFHISVITLLCFLFAGFCWAYVIVSYVTANLPG